MPLETCELLQGCEKCLCMKLAKQNNCHCKRNCRRREEKLNQSVCLKFAVSHLGLNLGIAQLYIPLRKLKQNLLMNPASQNDRKGPCQHQSQPQYQHAVSAMLVAFLSNHVKLEQCSAASHCTKSVRGSLIKTSAFSSPGGVQALGLL